MMSSENNNEEIVDEEVIELTDDQIKELQGGSTKIVILSQTLGDTGNGSHSIASEFVRSNTPLKKVVTIKRK